MRTINDLRDLVIHASIYSRHLFLNFPTPLIDGMRSPLDFRSGHLNLLVCQLVQTLQRTSKSILLVSFPYFSEHHSANRDILLLNLNYSLILPCLISFVTIPRIETTSAHIRMIVHHFCGRWYPCVDLETPKEPFNTLKYIKKFIFASPDVLSCPSNVTVI